jgi:F0F1-type ATP synthase assembly protein I
MFAAVGRYSHIGFLFGVLTIGGFFLGRLIDKKIQSFPVFSILIFLLGFGLAMYKFILMIDPKGKPGRDEE